MTYSTYRDLPTYRVTYHDLLHIYIIYFLLNIYIIVCYVFMVFREMFSR